MAADSSNKKSVKHTKFDLDDFTSAYLKLIYSDLYVFLALDLQCSLESLRSRYIFFGARLSYFAYHNNTIAFELLVLSKEIFFESY